MDAYLTMFAAVSYRRWDHGTKQPSNKEQVNSVGKSPYEPFGETSWISCMTWVI